MHRGKPIKVRAHAVALVRAGASLREAAAQTAKKFRTGVSEASVRKWIAAAESEPDATAELAPAPLDALDAPDAPDASAPLPDVEEHADVYEHTRAMMRRSMSISAAASRDGNHRAAQQAQRDVAAFTTILARLDAQRKATGDGITFTRAELDAARKQVQTLVAELAADVQRTGGLVCAQCGREIRIALAKGEQEK